MMLLPVVGYADFSIYGDLKSHHFRPKSYYVENHYLIGVEYHKWILIRYTNSEERLSTIVGKRKELYKFGLITFGYKYGMVSGYESDLDVIGDWAPFFMLNTVIDFGVLAVDFNLIPGAVCSLGWRVDF